MNTAIRAISLRLAGAATALLLSGCATLSPLSDVIIPNFSDENLGNPMAGYRPAGAVGAPVVNRGAPSAAAVTAASVPRRTGLEFSATQSVRTTEARGSSAATSTAATASGASTAKAAAPALSVASTGLLDQAVSSGGVGLADAALLDAALDVSPSEMGAVGAASGLLGAETAEGAVSEADGGGGNTFTATSAVSLLGITDVPGGGDASGSRASADGGSSASAAGVSLLTDVAQAGSAQAVGGQAGSAQAVGGGDPAFTTLSAEDVAALLGANPALAVVETSAVAAPPSAGPFAVATTAPALNEQAFIPVYGGNETLRVQPTPGEVSPGLARYRSGDLEVSLRFPASLALTQAYGAGAPTITLSLRNVGPTPVSLQPENLLTQFPPFEVYRWTGANWASLTLDVAYNLDRQGIAAPVTLQPGESTSRTELFGKVALLPLTVDLPPIDRLAIRLQIVGQGRAFGRIDSGFIPITLTDGGLTRGATNLTNGANPAFVAFDGT